MSSPSSLGWLWFIPTTTVTSPQSGNWRRERTCFCQRAPDWDSRERERQSCLSTDWNYTESVCVRDDLELFVHDWAASPHHEPEGKNNFQSSFRGFMEFVEERGPTTCCFLFEGRKKKCNQTFCFDFINTLQLFLIFSGDLPVSQMYFTEFLWHKHPDFTLTFLYFNCFWWLLALISSKADHRSKH